jgi:hypothetical protein
MGNEASSLLPEALSKVAGLGPSSLQAMHRFLHELELSALVEDIKDEADQLRIAGKLEPELLEGTIREHRQKHR